MLMKSKDTRTATNYRKKYVEAQVNGEPIEKTEVSTIEKDAKGKDFTDQIQQAVCNAGLGQVNDTFIHGWFSKVSLGEALSKLDEFKHSMYEEIRANITTYLPDGIRPIKLAVDVARQLRRYAQIISCLRTVIQRIQNEIESYLVEVTEFIAELDDAINRLMDDLDYMIYDIASLPATVVSAIGDGLIDAMNATGIMAVMQALDDLEDEIDGLQYQLDSFSDLIPNFSEYTESQIRQTLSTIADYPDELSYIFEHLDDYTLDQIESAIDGYQMSMRGQIESGRSSVNTFTNSLPDDFSDGRELYKSLSAQKNAVNETKSTYESRMSPPAVVDDTQELANYAAEIEDQLTGGGGGGIIGGGGSAVLIINEFIADQVRGYSSSNGGPIVRPDKSSKTIYTNEVGIAPEVRYEYDHFYDTLSGLESTDWVDLVDISGGPGVVFPDGTSRFAGLARMSVHTDELRFGGATIAIEIDGKEKGTYTLQGHGAKGKKVKDLDNPGHYVWEHFDQVMEINTLSTSSGELYPIMFKESFKIKVKKTVFDYEFQHTFFVESGIRYIMVTKEAL